MRAGGASWPLRRTGAPASLSSAVSPTPASLIRNRYLPQWLHGGIWSRRGPARTLGVFAYMKRLILYLLLCVSALAADIGVQLASTVTTINGMGKVTKETFTRGGQTNLVRWTMVEGSVVSL